MKAPQKFLLKAKNAEGFSLLEIAVVLAVLSLLSSIAIPNILKIGKDSDLSEAQALLNSAAADCLQSKRNGKDLTSTPPDENIVSDPKLEGINYKIKATSKNCSNFQIEPYKNGQSLAGKDLSYYTFGFRFEGDKLVKIATDEAADNRQSCKKWAGTNCAFDPEEEAKWMKYYEHISAVEARKKSCLTDANEQLKGPPPYTGSYKTWYAEGDAKCKDDPPNIPANGCTIESCNKINFAKDGQPLAGEEALKAALCTEWLEEIRTSKFTTPHPPVAPIYAPTKDLTGNCPGNPDYWFYKGVDLETELDFKQRICSDNLEEEKKTSGARKVEGCGDTTYYFCNSKIWDTEMDYKDCSCIREKVDKAEEGNNGAFKTNPPTGAPNCGDYWVCEGSYRDDPDVYNEKCVVSEPPVCPPPPTSACDRPRFYQYSICETYSRCMGRWIGN